MAQASFGDDDRSRRPRANADVPDMQASSSSLGGEVDPHEIFDLLMVLGQGSYGTVHKGRVKATGEIVAVKTIPLSGNGEQTVIQREINMLRECQHPNVVRYMGSWRASNSLWIVMEYCGGGSVGDLINSAGGQLEEEIIAYICSEMLAGLAYLHSIGKVHRDIKCGNVLLSDTGQVKLADFGVAAQLTNTMSKRKTYIGTPHWMAPEVIAESRYDGKVDVWALGVSAIEMAEGSPPRWRVHPMRVIFLIGREPPPVLTDRDHWSLTLHDFIAQCLQKEPKVRPTAKYLMQHKFVTQAAQGPPPALLSLIQVSQEVIMDNAVARQAGTLGAAPSREDLLAATGQFSWRVPPGGPTGTVMAGGGAGSTSPARGPWAKTGMVRARLEGLSFGGPARAAQTPRPTPEESLAWGDTVLVDGSPAGSQAGTVVGRGGTVVVGSSVGGGAGAGSGTVMEARPGREGGDYLAALRDASTSHNQGYLAAVSAAAKLADADASTAAGARAPSTAVAAASRPPAPASTTVRRGQPQGDRERMLERLRGVYSSGAVVPLPFLSASMAAPAALMADVRKPYVSPMHGLPVMGFGRRRVLQQDAWLHALQALAGQDSAGIGPGHAHAPKKPGDALPPAAVQQVQNSATLQNLARSLAYAQRTLAEEPLSPRSRERAQGAVDDLSDALRTILCL